MCGPEPYTTREGFPALPTVELRELRKGLLSYLPGLEQDGEHNVAVLLGIACDHLEAAADAYDRVPVDGPAPQRMRAGWDQPPGKETYA